MWLGQKKVEEKKEGLKKVRRWQDKRQNLVFITKKALLKLIKGFLEG
jgi:hypothetical protein